MSVFRFGLVALSAAAIGLGIWGCGGSGGSGGQTGLVSYAFVGSRTVAEVNVLSVGGNGTLSNLGIPAATDGPVSGLAVSPDGQYLYAANFDGSINQFQINSNGSLSPLSPASVPLPAGNYGIGITPNGQFLFATSDENKVYQYVIGGDGTLTANATPTVNVGDEPVHIEFSPDSEMAYVANWGDGTIGCYSISGAGVLSFIENVTTVAGVWTISLDRTGSYLYAGGSNEASVAQFMIESDNTLTAIGSGSIDGPMECYGVATSPVADIVISASYSGTDELARYSYNGTGALTEISPRVATDVNAQWPIEFSIDNVLYVCNQNDNSVSVYTVSPAGALTLRETQSVGNQPASIAFVSR